MLVDGFALADGQSWGDVLFAVPLAMLAYTGLETVANYAQEVENPGRDLPRGMFSGIGLVVTLTVAIAAIAVSAFPATNGTSELSEEWLEAPVAGVVTALDGELPDRAVDVLRVTIGLSGAFILLGAATTSVSGCTRLAHSMAAHGMLPREFGRFERRSLVSSEAILVIALVAIAVVVATGIYGDDAKFLASVYSFGVLVAFTLAQLAVIRLRFSEPGLRGRSALDPTSASVEPPCRSLPRSESCLTFGAFVLSMATHPGARYAGPPGSQWGSSCSG